MSYEEAAFILYVYRDEDQPELPMGWEIVTFCPDEFRNVNYFGVAFAKKYQDNVYELVIAHRGTVLSPSVLIDDLLLYLDLVPECIDHSALPFIEYAKFKAEEKYPGGVFMITHTGHSLGAAIASTCALINTDIEKGELENATTFENPGIGSIVNNLVKQGRILQKTVEQADGLFSIYNADVNLINTCKKQIGFVWNPQEVGFTYCKKGKETSLPDRPHPPYYALTYTPDQHKMVKMYQYFKNKVSFISNTESKSNDEWPCGVEAGYDCWRDIGGFDHHLRSHYWYEYTKLYWDAHPEIHAQYSDDQYSFRQEFEKKYLKDSPVMQLISVEKTKSLKNTLFKDNSLALISSIEANDINAVLHFLSTPINLTNSKDWQKRTALHVAVMYGNIDIIRLLLQHKANAKVEDVAGSTPLHIAAMHHDGEKLLMIFRLLVDHGADPDAKNDLNMTPYDILKTKQSENASDFFELVNNGFTLIEADGIQKDNKQANSHCIVM
jgi:hypothetical protein